ncbi:hypothetical protein ColLi_07172 [Colletotrichum liriopes]|uniref:SWR1-complex protein 3 domain-containing protein n=1 Tax=Colletotrichum liriopes TaxID=708192 RepID=A0AA37GP90_9PEZI|nr:hypothetical protein ColLi_07172 [Colletotrichum liriopes]
MERKRKLPARASARVEHVAKKRTVTPPEPRSVTPVPAPVEEPLPPPSLPKSIQAGKPLPTVEEPQPDDLPAREYQSYQESGVLAESLSRSRHKWMAEGLFEKYWTKPARKKNATEDPKNPAKDTMSKIGQVTITIEPHVFEATMWAIKDPKPPAPTTQATFRPIMQFGSAIACASTGANDATLVGGERPAKAGALSTEPGSCAACQRNTTSAEASRPFTASSFVCTRSRHCPGNALKSCSTICCGAFSPKFTAIKLNTPTRSRSCEARATCKATGH